MDHYLEFEYPSDQIEVWHEDILLASSSSAVLLKEIGGLGYPPTFYFEPADVSMDLIYKNQEFFFCYIKGESSFWSFYESDLAIWTYLETVEKAKPLEGKIAFSPKIFKIIRK